MRYAGGKLSQCSTAIHASLLCHADVAVVTGDGAWESWSLHLRRPIPEQKLGLCTSLLHCELRKRQALDNLPAHLAAAHIVRWPTDKTKERTHTHTHVLSICCRTTTRWLVSFESESGHTRDLHPDHVHDDVPGCGRRPLMWVLARSCFSLVCRKG